MLRGCPHIAVSCNLPYAELSGCRSVFVKKSRAITIARRLMGNIKMEEAKSSCQYQPWRGNYNK